MTCSGERTKKRAGSLERSRPTFDTEVEVKVWARQLVQVRRLALARERRLAQEVLLALVRLPV
jgi:hypothetical protein